MRSSRKAALRLLAACVLAAALVTAGRTSAQAASLGVPAGTFSGCPHDARPLPGPLASYVSAVRRDVLAFVHTSFTHIARTPRKLIGARITSVFLVRHWLPSGWIKSECGLKIWQRSVGADVYFSKMDLPHNPIVHCSACDRIIFLASLTRGGWTIWGDY